VLETQSRWTPGAWSARLPDPPHLTPPTGDPMELIGYLGGCVAFWAIVALTTIAVVDVL
jgi:hypothetical protein